MIAVNTRSDAKRTWEEFTEAIAGVARVPSSGITERTRLVEDLGLDSLTLTEVVVLLIVDFELERLGDELGERDWDGVTVGALFDEYLNEGREPSGAGVPDRD